MAESPPCSVRSFGLGSHTDDTVHVPWNPARSREAQVFKPRGVVNASESMFFQANFHSFDGNRCFGESRGLVVIL